MEKTDWEDSQSKMKRLNDVKEEELPIHSTLELMADISPVLSSNSSSEITIPVVSLLRGEKKH
jgi:hypothetical protein